MSKVGTIAKLKMNARQKGTGPQDRQMMIIPAHNKQLQKALKMYKMRYYAAVYM